MGTGFVLRGQPFYGVPALLNLGVLVYAYILVAQND